jgi:acyl-CoA synthetase (AMP-forming)/AMP-acid ligase II
VAVIDAATGESLTFAEMLEHGTELVGPMGERKSLLLILGRNDTFTASVYAGCLVGGHAAALLDDGQPDATIADIAAVYRARWVAGPPGTRNRLAQAGLVIDRVLEAYGGELISVVVGGDVPSIHPDLQLLLSTSGTTGSRKFVRLSAMNLASNAAAIAEYLDLTPDERPISSLPLHYTFGLSVLNSHWLAGAPVVLTTESVMQRSFWDVVRDHACTSLAGVPYTYLMLERIGFREMSLRSLTSLQQAGGALDPRLASIYGEYMSARGGRFFVMYGQTEATARMAYVPPHRLHEKLGSAGIAIPGGRLRIEPDDDGRWGSGVGEVVFEGPSVMLGYASGAEDLASGDVLGGVLRTGDIGYLDDEDYLYLVGRSKRITKVFGLRINLDEVEVSLRERGPAAVVAGEDAVWGFCAFGTDDAVDELADSLARRYRINKRALRFRRVDEIPTAPSGKIDYEQVKRWIPT